jgi:hypothetical protein
MPIRARAWPRTSIKAVLSKHEGMGQKTYRNPACIKYHARMHWEGSLACLKYCSVLKLLQLKNYKCKRQSANPNPITRPVRMGGSTRILIKP